jgi:pilus assembly protein Flp/PilA
MAATFFKKIVDDTSGATAIEYGLIVALITVAMIASLGSVARTTIDMWNDVATRTTRAMSN